PRYVPNAKPLFIEDDVFKTIIPLEVAQLGLYVNKWLKWLDLPDAQSERIKEGLKEISLPSDLTDASWDELILHLVPSWHKKGTKLKRLDWPAKQCYEEEAIREVPSWTTDGTKLLHKKVMYLIQILTLSSTPVSLDDMMATIGYKNRA